MRIINGMRGYGLKRKSECTRMVDQGKKYTNDGRGFELNVRVARPLSKAIHGSFDYQMITRLVLRQRRSVPRYTTDDIRVELGFPEAGIANGTEEKSFVKIFIVLSGVLSSYRLKTKAAALFLRTLKDTR